MKRIKKTYENFYYDCEKSNYTQKWKNVFFYVDCQIFKFYRERKQRFDEFSSCNYDHEMINFKIFQKYTNFFKICQFLSTIYICLFTNNIFIDRHVKKHKNQNEKKFVHIKRKNKKRLIVLKSFFNWRLF